LKRGLISVNRATDLTAYLKRREGKNLWKPRRGGHWKYQECKKKKSIPLVGVQSLLGGDRQKKKGTDLLKKNQG